MKTLVVFYSYSGRTKRIAIDHAESIGADCVELLEEKKQNLFAVYLLGSLAARKRKPAKLQAFHIDWAQYDEIVLAAPIWAGYPAPAVNTFLQQLPAGKKVALWLTSGSGNSSSSRAQTIAAVENTGSEAIAYKDIKTA